MASKEAQQNTPQRQLNRRQTRTKTGIVRLLKQFSSEKNEIQNNLNKIQNADKQIHTIKEKIDENQFQATRILDYRNADLSDEQYKEMLKKQEELARLLKEKEEWEAEQKRLHEEKEKQEQLKLKQEQSKYKNIIQMRKYQNQKLVERKNNYGNFASLSNLGKTSTNFAVKKQNFLKLNENAISEKPAPLPDKFKNARKCQCLFTRKQGCHFDDCVYFQKKKQGSSMTGLSLDHPFFAKKRISAYQKTIYNQKFGNNNLISEPTKAKSMAKLNA